MKRTSSKHTTHWLDHIEGEGGVVNKLSNKELERLRLMVVAEEYVRRCLGEKPRRSPRPA